MPGMKVLLTGASGFIGRRLRRRLLERGHTVVGTSRHPPPQPDDATRWHAIDITRALRPQDWLAALDGVEVVVNAAGSFDASADGFAAIHRDAPRALFEACVQSGVGRVVQLSALAGDTARDVPFIATKHAADAALLALPLDAVVVRPSLVYGPDGASSRMLLGLASAPLVVLPRLDGGVVQPVHVDDLVAALLALVEGAAAPARCVALVGAQALPLADYLRALRTGLGLPRTPVLTLPRPLVRIAARIGDLLPGAWLRSDSLRLLEAGSQADASATTALIGRAPRAPPAFIATGQESALRAEAALAWGRPLLRGAIALVWLATAAVSFGLYPADDSRALLAAVGVPAGLRSLLLYGAAGFDLVLGMLTLVAPGRALWRAQIVLMLFYMAVIAWRLPGFWLHPFGPLTKNLPMLAALLLLDALEPRKARRWNT